jgi:hypothetical protein
MNEEQKQESYKQLMERINKLRIECLFEEPCPLYEDDEDGVE